MGVSPRFAAHFVRASHAPVEDASPTSLGSTHALVAGGEEGEAPKREGSDRRGP